MKIGVKLPNSGPFASVERIRAVAVECDRLGYDSLWVHDHITRSAEDAKYHFVAGSLEAWKPPILPNVYDSMSTLLYVAGITSRVILGTSVVVLPLRNPVVLAKEAACLDQFSGGRFILGVGVGGDIYARDELGAIGALHFMGKRGKVTDEWIDVIRLIWQESKASFKGTFIEVTDAEVYPKPVQESGLPIWYGGSTEPAMRRTGQRADGWLPMFLTPSELQEGKRRIGEYAREAGRDPSGIEIASEHWLSLDSNKTRAEDLARQTTVGLGTYIASLRGSNVGRERLERLDRNFVGDADSVLSQVRAYQEAGVDHVILRVISRDFDQMMESLHVFKERVMDRLDARP